MDADGKLFGKQGTPREKARCVEIYERLLAEGFEGLAEVEEDDLESIAGLHALRLEHFEEERRMHFGAFALVGLSLILLLPSVLTIEEYFLPLSAVAALLLILLVPYVFVYRKYEQGVRRAMRESFLIENERLLRRQKR
ncbi:MAG: hypothetical protein R6V85_18680 [Polyangia bacterium]